MSRLAPKNGETVGTAPTASTDNVIDLTSDIVGLTIEAHSSQTANLFVVQDSSQTELIAITPAGGIMFDGGGSSKTLDKSGNNLHWGVGVAMYSGGATVPGAPSYTFQGDTDTGVYSPAADQLGLAAGGNGILIISDDVGDEHVLLTCSDAATIGQTIKLAAAQSANAFEVQNNSGTEQFSIGPNGIYGTPSQSTTLAAAATEIAITSNVVKVTGDAGGNTVVTITGGRDGMILVLIFEDNLVTITDTAAATADTVDLKSAFTSASHDVLTLVHDGTKWYEASRA